MTRVCLECGGACWVWVAHEVVSDADYAMKCPECAGTGVEPDPIPEFEFDTGASGDTHDFLNQIVNDVVEGR